MDIKKVPEDLKSLYELSCEDPCAYSFDDDTTKRLIERIAQLQARVETAERELAFRDFEQARDSSIAHDYGSYADIQKALGTEITMHAAWMKRATEAEARVAELTKALERAVNGLEAAEILFHLRGTKSASAFSKQVDELRATLAAAEGEGV